MHRVAGVGLLPNVGGEVAARAVCLDEDFQIADRDDTPAARLLDTTVLRPRRRSLPPNRS